MPRNPLHDGVHNADMNRTRTVAAKTLNSIQDHRPAEQIAGIAVMFLLLCERFDFSAPAALEVAGNILRQAKFADADHFQGVRDYLANEL